MNISPKRKKWLQATGIFLVVLLLVIAVFYYTIAFRLRDTIQFIVDKESNGIYSFNASRIEVSLAKRQIAIKNASFNCKDTAITTPHYDVEIPDIFLSVRSLQEMVFARKLKIDSLDIALPQLKIHEHTKQDTRHAAFHASKIFEVLQKLKSHLQVKSFSIIKHRSTMAIYSTPILSGAAGSAWL